MVQQIPTAIPTAIPLPPGCYVALHIGSGPGRGVGPEIVVDDARKKFQLSDEIWIERLDSPLATQIQKACEPPHFNVSTVEHDRHLYGFLRYVPQNESRRFEGMNAVLGAIALSRLIHPTSTGDRYCANIFQFGLENSVIQAIQYRGTSPDISLSGKQRDWLSIDDGETLRKLMPWLAKDKMMHKRVHRAYWNHEYAMRSYYLDARWIFVVSAFEGLLTVGDKDMSRQFRERVAQLAAEFKVSLSEDDLRKAYKLRSKLVHAEKFLVGLDYVSPEVERDDLYEQLESLLRITVRRCLLDETFGDFFSSDIAIEARWPLKAKP